MTVPQCLKDKFSMSILHSRDVITAQCRSQASNLHEGLVVVGNHMW